MESQGRQCSADEGIDWIVRLQALHRRHGRAIQGAIRPVLLEFGSLTNPGLDELIKQNLDRYSLKAFSKEAIRRAEREVIGKVLQQTCWNRKEAAERLQISYKALLYKIKETGLER